MDFDLSVSVFKALADPSRLKVLQLLARPPVNECATQGGVCACDLESHLGLAQPTVSHHMRLLTQAGLVTGSKRGRWMDYRLNPDGLAHVSGLLQGLQAPPALPVDAGPAAKGMNP